MLKKLILTTFTALILTAPTLAEDRVSRDFIAIVQSAKGHIYWGYGDNPIHISNTIQNCMNKTKVKCFLHKELPQPGECTTIYKKTVKGRGFYYIVRKTKENSSTSSNSSENIGDAIGGILNSFNQIKDTFEGKKTNENPGETPQIELCMK